MMDYRDAAQALLEQGYSAQRGELFAPSGKLLRGTVRCSGGLFEAKRIAWAMIAAEADRNLQKQRMRDLRGTILHSAPVSNRFR